MTRRDDIEALLVAFFSPRDPKPEDGKIRRCIACGRFSQIVPIDAMLADAPVRHEPDCVVVDVLDIAAESSFSRADLELIEAGASTAHDYIWSTHSVTQAQASDCIWSIHHLVRAALAAPLVAALRESGLEELAREAEDGQYAPPFHELERYLRNIGTPPALLMADRLVDGDFR
jgi:hypothetical protein